MRQSQHAQAPMSLLLHLIFQLTISVCAQQPTPPPPPPAAMAALPAHARALQERQLAAPPPSPPWADTEAGQREQGRGWLLQHRLSEFLHKRRVALRSDDGREVRAALSEVALLALESTITQGGRSSWLSAVHPVAFRKACVAGSSRSAGGSGSVVEALADLVRGASGEIEAEAETLGLTLQAIEAIAIDDPSTDVDNDHALAICATGIVPDLVRLLSSPLPLVHTHAASATAALAENKHAARMLVGAGVVVPLIVLGRHGGDLARRHALNALRVLAIDRDARDSIVRAGGKDLVRGLARHGHAQVRPVAADLDEQLSAQLDVSVDAKGHAAQARATRVSQSKLWSRAQRAQRPRGSASDAPTRYTPPRAHNAFAASPGLDVSRVLTG